MLNEPEKNERQTVPAQGARVPMPAPVSGQRRVQSPSKNALLGLGAAVVLAAAFAFKADLDQARQAVPPQPAVPAELGTPGPGAAVLMPVLPEFQKAPKGRFVQNTGVVTGPLPLLGLDPAPAVKQAAPRKPAASPQTVVSDFVLKISPKLIPQRWSKPSPVPFFAERSAPPLPMAVAPKGVENNAGAGPGGVQSQIAAAQTAFPRMNPVKHMFGSSSLPAALQPLPAAAVNQNQQPQCEVCGTDVLGPRAGTYQGRGTSGGASAGYATLAGMCDGKYVYEFKNTSKKPLTVRFVSENGDTWEFRTQAGGSTRFKSSVKLDPSKPLAGSIIDTPAGSGLGN